VRAEEFCTAKGEPKFDLILLDPPRQGAAEQTAQLVELADLLYKDAVPDIVPDIVMVSCNPHTAVRDIAVLVAAGWQLEEVQMIDQFVRTAHTEIVIRLVFDGRQNTRR
jgi:tRNA/tmRNA/rRNA uracil-C5-methylase (TrmA/RlmC/RlmD family)